MPYAPYVTSLPWISHYGCRYVVHGDDITSDSSGEDCYRFVKAAGRFKVVKRTPSISTTDLVGRMLLCTRTHFIKSLTKYLSGEEGNGSEEERKVEGAALKERMRLYATDESGMNPGSSVWFWTASREAKVDDTEEEKGMFSVLCQGAQPKPGQRVVYVDGGFDLFSSGHIEFLRQVIRAEEALGKKEGWYSKEAVDERVGKGSDYGPAFIVAGVHDDLVINQWKGVNYPIMNIYERGLCVLQCKVSRRLTSTSCTNRILVHQFCHFWSTVLAHEVLSQLNTMGKTRRGISRPNKLHAPHLRSLHGTESNGHLPRNRRTQLRFRECRANRTADPQKSRHV